MYKQCKTEASKNRQKLLEKTFFDLLKVKYYEDVTVSEICDKAGVPRKDFYRYFDCKEGLLNALIQHILDGYQEHCLQGKITKRTLKSELKSFFEFWIKEPCASLIKILNKNSLLGHLNKFSLEYNNNKNFNASKFLPNETEQEVEQVFNFAISGLMSMMFNWFNKGCKKSTDEMAETACRMLSKPLFSNLDKLEDYKI